MIAYEFYTGTFLGSTVPEHDWNFYAARAVDQLERYKRIYTVTVPVTSPDPESMAVCAMAEALYGFDLIANGEGGVQSASIGSVSTSYGSAAAVDTSPKGQARELYRLACQYLDIYRGCG